MTTVTLSSLQSNYASYLQAQNSNINAYNINTYWHIQGGAMASFALDLYYNLEIVQNSIYIQNSIGNQIDKRLYEMGLSQRISSTYTTLKAVVISDVPVIISKGTVFSSAKTGLQYQTIQDISVLTAGDTVTLVAVVAGASLVESVGEELSSGSIKLSAISTASGTDAESDQSCINRALTAVRSPVAGARETDYQTYPLEADVGITYVATIPEFININSVGILGVFVFSGGQMTDYLLNQGLIDGTTYYPYTRTASKYQIDQSNYAIQAQRLVGLSVLVGTTETYQIASNTNPLSVTVSLASGYALDTSITANTYDEKGNIITTQLTVEQLIKREIRRTIVNQAYGATEINNRRYVTVDSLYDVNGSLSASNGSIAQVLVNLIFNFDDIDVTSYSKSNTTIRYVYDVESYDAIKVTLQ